MSINAKHNIAIVTGGAGFIGSHMVDLLLRKNYKVRVLDNLFGGRKENLNHHKNNKDLEVCIKDIRNCRITDKVFENVKVIFHFAGIGDIVPSIERPYDYLDVNCQGTINILECAKENKIKHFVYAASSSCYGQAKVPTDENHPIDTKYPYALSKYFGEQAVLHWSKVYDLKANSIRIFNAYGTRSRTSGAYGAVFGVFLKQKLANKSFTVVGDGEQTRDFLYVTDVCSAFYSVFSSNYQGEIFNLGAGKPQSINKLVKLLKGTSISIPKRPGEPECTWANTKKIKEFTNWKPKVSFEEGVKLVLKNIDYWKDSPLWDENSIHKATNIWFKFMEKKNG